MQNVLIVVDMQNDFITGSLGSKEAEEIVEPMKERILNFVGPVLFTRDTHYSNYLETEEGKNLPVKHCIKNTKGWEIVDALDKIRKTEPIDKETFGSTLLGEKLLKMDEEEEIASITLMGLCTDICVISNALLVKAFLPNAHIIVDASLSRGVNKTRHNIALEAMKACQIEIIGE